MHRLLWATSFAIASVMSISNPAWGQSKPKEVEIQEIFGDQKERVITVTRVEDLDDIHIRLGDKSTRVRMVSVTPFREWPVDHDADWAKHQESLKKKAVNQLEGNQFHMRLASSQKEGKAPAVYLESRCDYQVDRESKWQGLKPAERVGWARTSQNIHLVHQGLTIYCPDCESRPHDLEKLFERAQQDAEVFRRGLWKEHRFAHEVKKTDSMVRH